MVKPCILCLSFGLALGIGGIAQVALAQSTPVSFPPGSLIEPGGGQVLRVIGCHKHATYDWWECDVVQWENGGPSSRKVTVDAKDLLSGVNRVRASKGLPMLTPAQANAGMAAKGAPATAMAPAQTGGTAALSGPCPRTPYGGPVSGTAPASAALFQRKIADLYTMQTRAPYWYGVTFQSFSVGAPIRNVVVNQGGGAYRVNDGAPVNAMMYPVKSTYVVCEQSPGQAERSRIVNSHYCFVTAAREWSCAGGGGPPPTITRLR